MHGNASSIHMHAVFEIGLPWCHTLLSENIFLKNIPSAEWPIYLFFLIICMFHTASVINKCFVYCVFPIFSIRLVLLENKCSACVYSTTIQPHVPCMAEHRRCMSPAMDCHPPRVFIAVEFQFRIDFAALEIDQVRWQTRNGRSRECVDFMAD